MQELYEHFKEELNRYPFIIIVGKYDQILGPRPLFSSIKFKNEKFIATLLRDALNTNSKYVNLDFNQFYAQVCKIEIRDETARGGQQLYAIILLRHSGYPQIPILHFKRIEMIFHKIGSDKILLDDENVFKNFSTEINNIYIKKFEILPLESYNLQVRSGINTIQGFCEILLEEKKEYGKISEENVIEYLKLMLDSCKEIIETLNKHFSQTTE